MKSDEKLFREMAALYIKQEAEDLRREMEHLPARDTASLDSRVRRQITRLKMRPYVRPMILAAACIALIIFAPQALNRSGPDMSDSAAKSGSTTAEADTAPETIEEFAAFSLDIEEDAEEEAAYDTPAAAQEFANEGELENPMTAGQGEEDLPNVETGGIDEAIDDSLMGGAAEAAVPMTFALPSGYEQVGYEEDNGKSIYLLSYQDREDVVLVLEENVDASVLDLAVMRLGDQDVYYKYTADYSQIVFEKDGIFYDLTCREGIDPLIVLGQAIVDAL